MVNMFNREKLPAAGEPSAEPSPSAIAAAVGKGVGLESAEEEVSQLRARHKAIRAEMIALIASTRAIPNSGHDRKIMNLSEETRRIEVTITKARREMAPARAAHARKVESALQTVMADSANGILAAIRELRFHGQRLQESASVILRAGGDIDQFAIPLELLGGIEAAALRIIAK